MKLIHRDMGDGFTHLLGKSCGCEPREPVRFQRERRKDYRMPEGGISVTRPSYFANWLCAGDPGRLWIKHVYPSKLRVIIEADLPTRVTHQQAAYGYRRWLIGGGAPGEVIPGWNELNPKIRDVAQRTLTEKRADVLAKLYLLAGADLGCWCPVESPCHADALLEALERTE